MTHRTLIVAHGEGQSSRCDTLLARILEQWPPDSAAPTVRMVDHGSLALERSLAQHPTLVVGDPTLRGAKLTQLLDMLDGRCVPALVLLDSGRSGRDPRDHGLERRRLARPHRHRALHARSQAAHGPKTRP
ncbi:MAG: hypothetical protein KF705_14025 [Phycisphaeraceae bacterium]|nr:hypothetical protein [Phycisphaeraceae bacterium]